MNYLFYKEFVSKYVYIKFSMLSKNSFMGRFGGGWNWKVGVQFGGRTAIISLLVAEIRITLTRGEL